jgi:hypothetical protein
MERRFIEHPQERLLAFQSLGAAIAVSGRSWVEWRSFDPHRRTISQQVWQLAASVFNP